MLNKSNYNKFPEIAIQGFNGYSGWKEIVDELLARVSDTKRTVVVIETYPGVQIEPFIKELETIIKGIHFIPASAAMKKEAEIEAMVFPYVTEDPVFGYITPL